LMPALCYKYKCCKVLSDYRQAKKTGKIMLANLASINHVRLLYNFALLST
jgi:hypothetical protein